MVDYKHPALSCDSQTLGKKNQWELRAHEKASH
jgi:hypothetical protein